MREQSELRVLRERGQKRHQMELLIPHSLASSLILKGGGIHDDDDGTVKYAATTRVPPPRSRVVSWCVVCAAV